MRTKPCPKIELRTTAFAKMRSDPFRPPRHRHARILPRGKFLVLTPSAPHPGLAFTTDTSSCSTTGTNCWCTRGMHSTASYLANTRAAGGCQRGRSADHCEILDGCRRVQWKHAPRRAYATGSDLTGPRERIAFMDECKTSSDLKRLSPSTREFSQPLLLPWF